MIQVSKFKMDGQKRNFQRIYIHIYTVVLQKNGCWTLATHLGKFVLIFSILDAKMFEIEQNHQGDTTNPTQVNKADHDHAQRPS